MFNTVWFNTKEKMMKCFEMLSKDKSRYVHTFHIVEPIEDNKYFVYYISKVLDNNISI